MRDDTPVVATTTGRVNMPSAKPKRSIAKRIILVLLVVLLVVAAALGGYWWRDKEATSELNAKSAEITALQATNKSLKQQVAAQSSSSTGTHTEVTCTVKQPGASAVENIKAAITSGNTAALEGYMAPSVNVIYAASDGLGQRTAANAVSDITSFISNPAGAAWSFDVPASVLSSYGQGSYKQYFPGTALVAQATDTRLLSISFDCNGKIATALLVANESSLQ